MRFPQPEDQLVQTLTSSEESNVREQVQNGDRQERKKTVTLQRLDGVLHLIDNIEGIGITCVREDDAVKGIGQTVWLRGAVEVLESISEVPCGVFHPGVAAETDQTGNANEDEGQDFDGADGI